MCDMSTLAAGRRIKRPTIRMPPTRGPAPLGRRAGHGHGQTAVQHVRLVVPQTLSSSTDHQFVVELPV